ncbi:MAG: DUF938 domain-containing protein [Microcoleaceae cyanobacterium]
MTPQDLRRFAPATDRNCQPILEVLEKFLPPSGTVLEVASGTGQHSVFFAPQLQPRHWLSSDPDPQNRASIIAWTTHEPCNTLHGPVDLDARLSDWPLSTVKSLDLKAHPITAIVNINMIHISPWAACLGLISGAKRVLSTGGILYLYGPFKRGGEHTAPSNQAFDQSLQLQNPEWGVRDLDEVTAVAQAAGFGLVNVVQMPANNLSVIFQRI